jgi:HAD superfamily hydrolase (TIGR01509 family)
MIKRLIFDIDGTLITNVDLKEAIKRALNKYNILEDYKVDLYIDNIKIYEETYNKYDRELYLNYFSKVLGTTLKSDFLDILFNELKKTVPKDNKKLITVLESLSNYQLVLLSNYFEESQRNRLEAMGINKYFSEYYGEELVKPNKEIYLKALGNNKNSQCVIIGDNKLLDIDIPKSLGIKTIYINKDGDLDSVLELDCEYIKTRLNY